MADTQPSAADSPRKSFPILVSGILLLVIAGIAVKRAGDSPAVNSPEGNSSVVNSMAAPAAESASSTSVPALPAGGKKADSIDLLVVRLQQRLEKEPSDADGWVLLGRSYHFLQRWDDAGAAFAKARALGWKGEVPDLPAAAMDSVHATTGHAATAADAGQAVFQGVQDVVQQQAQQLRNPVEAPADNKAVASTSVTAVVSADPALSKQFPADTVVFIFARAAQGPRMPLAVVRKTLGDLPAQIELSDAQAMMPDQNLSKAAAVIIGARLSRSGTPMSQPGDIEALSGALTPKGQQVELVLKAAP